jgi:hypothetical protein
MATTESITTERKCGRWDLASRTQPYRAFWEPGSVPDDPEDRARFVSHWMQPEEQ